jgi:hypothetical protein
MQIDLQNPLEIYKVIQDGVELNREGNVFIELIALQKPGVIKELTVFYGGKPKWLSTRHGTEELLEKRTAMEIHL